MQGLPSRVADMMTRWRPSSAVSILCQDIEGREKFELLTVVVGTLVRDPLRCRERRGVGSCRLTGTREVHGLPGVPCVCEILDESVALRELLTILREGPDDLPELTYPMPENRVLLQFRLVPLSTICNRGVELTGLCEFCKCVVAKLFDGDLRSAPLVN